MKLKILIIVVVLVVCLFITSIIVSTKNNVDRTLKFNSEIDIYVKKRKNVRGYSILNDSIAISNMTPRLIDKKEDSYLSNPNYLPAFKNLSGKYRLVKNSKSDTLYVIIQTDTIFFKLLID